MVLKGSEEAEKAARRRLAVVLWLCPQHDFCGTSTEDKYTNIQTDRPNARELTCMVKAKTRAFIRFSKGQPSSQASAVIIIRLELLRQGL